MNVQISITKTLNIILLNIRNEYIVCVHANIYNVLKLYQ